MQVRLQPSLSAWRHCRSTAPSLLDRARSLNALIGGYQVAVDMAVQVDHVGLRRPDQDRGMRGRNDPEILLVNQFLQQS